MVVEHDGIHVHGLRLADIRTEMNAETYMKYVHRICY